MMSTMYRFPEPVQPRLSREISSPSRRGCRARPATRRHGREAGQAYRSGARRGSSSRLRRYGPGLRRRRPELDLDPLHAARHSSRRSGIARTSASTRWIPPTISIVHGSSTLSAIVAARLPILAAFGLVWAHLSRFRLRFGKCHLEQALLRHRFSWSSIGLHPHSRPPRHAAHPCVEGSRQISVRSS
jgi:hypothetical protein